MTKNEDLPSYPQLTSEQRRMVDQLSEADIRRIDQAILSNASTQWTRTDRIILTTMIELDNGMGLPNRYFLERMEHLAQEGLLESKGGLPCSRSGEVRLKNE